MPITVQFVKNPRVRHATHGKSTSHRCVHCYQPLVMAANASRSKKDRHVCPESLLAKQPAAPAPFN